MTNSGPRVVGLASTKGGVYKSTIARLLVTEATRVGLRAKIGDCDHSKPTCANWMIRRMRAKLDPVFEVTPYLTPGAAISASQDYDLLVIDSPGRVDDWQKELKELAEKAHILIQPTGPTLDDMEPAVLLFNALTKKGIPRKKLVLVLTGIDTKTEEDYAREYLTTAGYTVLQNVIPHKRSLRFAQDLGKAITEVSSKSLRDKLRALTDEIADHIERD